MSFLQAHKEFKALALVSLSSYCIYGVAAYEPQENALQLGIDILVGTPGQILDHVTRGSLDLQGRRSRSGRSGSRRTNPRSTNWRQARFVAWRKSPSGRKFWETTLTIDRECACNYGGEDNEEFASYGPDLSQLRSVGGSEAYAL